MRVEAGTFLTQEYLGLISGVSADLYRAVGVEEQAVVRFREENIWKGSYLEPNINGEDIKALFAFHETHRGSTVYLGIRSPSVDKVLIVNSDFGIALTVYGGYSRLEAVAEPDAHSERVFMAFRATLEDLKEFQQVSTTALAREHESNE